MDLIYSNLNKSEKIKLHKMLKEIIKLKGNISEEKINEILNSKIRLEKIVLKDAKQRTFITNDESRDSLVNLVYDVTYGIVHKNKDNIVVIDALTSSNLRTAPGSGVI